MVNGWKSVSLLDCGEIIQGLTYQPDNVKPYGLLVLRSSNIQEEKLSFDDCVFVDCEIDEKQYVRKNDILICVRNGSTALIGKCALINADFKATFGAFMSIFRGENSEYFFQVFRSNIVQKQIRNNSNATINQITKRDFEEIIIPVPDSKIEQHAIVEALSDADGYIAALEKLIAKKKAIKQGAMQELLSGKRRLPGFSGDWVEKPLEQIMRIRKERINPKDARNYRCIELEHIEPVTGHLLGWNNSNNQQSLKAIFEPGDVLFGKLRPYLRKYYFPIFYGVCSTEFWVLTSISEYISNRFIYYLIQSARFLDIANSTTGTKMPRADWTLLKDVEFSLPKCVEEQFSIAAILSDMDREIELLTVKLNKARLIKQGMMQELLSGRIRLLQQKSEAINVPEVILLPERKKEHVPAPTAPHGHNQQFDDAVMIAGIVNAFYSDRYPLGRKKVQKLLYLLRRKQDESTVAFKKKAAGPYADEVRYKGGEPIAKSNHYIATTTTKDKGTTFAQGKNIGKALEYIQRWGKQDDISWLTDKFRYTTVDDLELLATVDMAICDLEEAGTPVSVASIKHLIATNKEWQAKLQKRIFADSKIAKAISDLKSLL